MISASELLEAYANEEINHDTKSVYRTEVLDKEFSLKIASSDITDIELQMMHRDKPTMTFNAILDQFMKNNIVGSTEISLCKGDHETRELELVSLSEEIIVLKAL